MERSLRRLAAVLLTVSLVILCALVSVHVVALNLGFYRAKWLEFGVPESTGMPLSDLTAAGRTLMDYFTGKAPSPQLDVTIYGERRPLYNETELKHLEDVKSLFTLGITLEQVLAAEVLGIALYLNRARERRTLSTALLSSTGVSLGIIAALAVPARMDFSGFWTNFHLVTFSNDLWILDPNTDWLIRMFPEEFFLSAVQRIGLTASGILAFYLLSGLLIRNLAADDRH